MVLSASAAERRAAGAPCGNRSLSPAHRELSSKPKAAAGVGRMVDKRTDGRTPDRYIDHAPHTMRAMPMNCNRPGDISSMTLLVYREYCTCTGVTYRPRHIISKFTLVVLGATEVI